jgi:magnesium chelatase family protein
MFLKKYKNMFSKIFSSTINGIESQLITVEIDISLGLLQWNIVGLPDLAVKESKDRIIAAIRNSGIKIPERKITINLSPADTKKKGSLFDFAIIMGILDATKIIVIPEEIKRNAVFIGEISLDGTLLDAKGTLSIASDLKKLGKKYLFLPPSRAHEALLIEGITIYAPSSISDCVQWFLKEDPLPATDRLTKVNPEKNSASQCTLDDMIGNELAKRALMISIAGKHGLLLVGSPGSGKTFLAEQSQFLLPPMTYEEKIAVSKIYSSIGKIDSSLLFDQRPFVSPHHSVSLSGLIGGGSIPKPGAISLAHHGILFLDELLEFNKSAIESLRQPLESKTITITRAQAEYTFPADFLLISATNPCPCGYFQDKRKHCTCSELMIKNYIKKLSGPLSDRIDLHVGVYGNEKIIEEKIKPESPVSHQNITQKIKSAISLQEKRYGSSKRNGDLKSYEIETYCTLDPEAKKTLVTLYEKLTLSMRSYFKIIKIAQTIANIDNSEIILKKHILEASSYRALDKLLN